MQTFEVIRLILFRDREELSGKLRDLEPTGPPDRTYKVVFAGDAAVGKTSFINRITKVFRRLVPVLTSS